MTYQGATAINQEMTLPSTQRGLRTFLEVWTWYTGEGIVGRETVSQNPQRWEIKEGAGVFKAGRWGWENH